MNSTATAHKPVCKGHVTRYQDINFESAKKHTKKYTDDAQINLNSFPQHSYCQIEKSETQLLTIFVIQSD